MNSRIDELSKQYPQFVVDESRFERTTHSLGKGGFSVIYKSLDKKTNEYVAQKEMISAVSDPSTVFFNEVMMLISLHDSPYIAKLIGFTTNPPYSIFLELCEGGILEKYIKPKDKYEDEEEEEEEEEEEPVEMLDPTERNFVAYCCAVGMNQLYEKKIIHNDFKSSNVVLLGKEPSRRVPRIIDFGAAKFESESDEVNAQLTVAWSAPECLDGKCNLKSDVYSYGMMLWQMLYEKTPWHCCSFLEITKRVKSETRNRPEVSVTEENRKLVELIQKCWDMEPEKRPNFFEIAEEFKNGNVNYPKTDRNQFLQMIEEANKAYE